MRIRPSSFIPETAGPQARARSRRLTTVLTETKNELTRAGRRQSGLEDQAAQMLAALRRRYR